MSMSAPFVSGETALPARLRASARGSSFWTRLFEPITERAASLELRGARACAMDRRSDKLVWRRSFARGVIAVRYSAQIVSGSATREFVHHVGDVFAPDGCVIAVIAALASILCVLRFATARLRAPCVILRCVLLRSRCHAALLHTLSRAHFTESTWLCRAYLSFRVHFTMNPCIWQTFVRIQM